MDWICGLKREKLGMFLRFFIWMIAWEVLLFIEMGKRKGRGNLEILKRVDFVKGFCFGYVKVEMFFRFLSGDV